MQITLRGAILSKYSNASAFGKAIGWSRKKASDIMNGRRRPSAKEMEDIANILGIKDDHVFMALFFSH